MLQVFWLAISVDGALEEGRDLVTHALRGDVRPEVPRYVMSNHDCHRGICFACDPIICHVHLTRVSNILLQSSLWALFITVLVRTSVD